MIKILIVDDDKDLLVGLKALFKQNGFDISVRISCDEGMEIICNGNSFTDTIQQ